MPFEFLSKTSVENGVSAIQLAVRYLTHWSGQKFMDVNTSASTEVKDLCKKILYEAEPQSARGFLRLPQQQTNELISLLTAKAMELVSKQVSKKPQSGERLLEEMRKRNVVN